MRQQSFLSLGPHDFHRVAYTEWGSPESSGTLVCVHGLTRNGRDFDALARAMSARCRVICPDVAGRGRSEWLADKRDYAYPTYCADMAALLARLHAERVDWVGTSMGGFIGMLLAALRNSPVRRLVLNDIGPFVPRAALERIAGYVGGDPRFPGLAEVESYLRDVHAPFGPLADAQWRHLAEHGARRTESGDYALVYDPGIAEPIRAAEPADVDIWAVWDAIPCPVLVIRGEQSDVLLAETAEEMKARGPRATVLEIPGTGHAPALMADAQIDAIARWLKDTRE